MPCENRSRDDREAALSQGIPGTAGNHENVADWPGTNVFSEPPERISAADVLISDFWLPE